MNKEVATVRLHLPISMCYLLSSTTFFFTPSFIVVPRKD